MFHKSILTETFLSFFENRKIFTFIDGTLGAGGHAKALLEAHPEIECLYGLDQDEDALEIAKKTLEPFKQKIRLLHLNFRMMDQLDCKSIDGIFLDLGVSSMQLDRAEKGFSFSKQGPLDMRMDHSQSLDAAKVVNTFSERQLGEIFRDLGEEPRWKKASQAIVHARKKKRIKTTEDLAEVLKPVLSRGGKKINPLTLIFQGLRIFVNDELKALEEGLKKGIAMLSPLGRMG